ncbi:right-handed parallel beta-helix repeat-containing protein [bacterium]|nr:right-handed parallel beta-helix repeat-containing protein [bacterium]
MNKILISRKSNYRGILIMIIITILTIVPSIWAVDYISVGSGNWNNPAVWDQAGYPDVVEDTATIANGHTVRITADLTCGAVTINNGGVVNHTAYTNLTWIIQGDISVSGTLTLGPGVNIKIDCITTMGLYGIIVESGAIFSANGGNKHLNDCVITALNPDYNTYIYLKDGSQTLLQYCKISEMGIFGAPKYGIYIENVDGNIPGEGILIKGCIISNNYNYGIYMSGCSKNNTNNGKGIIDTVVDGDREGIWVTNCSSNTFEGNYCYNNNSGTEAGSGINVYGGSNNILSNNICYNNQIAGIRIVNSNNNILNNNICYDQWYVTGIDISDSHNNQLINNITYNNPYGVFLNGSNNNTLTGNIIYSNSTGFYGYGNVGNELIDCSFGTLGENTQRDIYLTNFGAFTLILKNCQLSSTTEVDTTNFSVGGWIISQKHDQIPGLVRIWGDYNIPAVTTNWQYDTELYSGSGDANVQKKIEFYYTPIGTELIVENAKTLNITGGCRPIRGLCFIVGIVLSGVLL